MIGSCNHVQTCLRVGMIRRKSGHIIGISSIAGKFGTPLSTSYSASKFALLGMLEGLKYEVRV